MSATRAADPVGLSHSQIVGLLTALLMPVFLGSLDGTIVATALPTIGRDLGQSVDLSWIVSVYLLTSTAAAPLLGKLSDTRGRRAALVTSQSIFLLGSLACAAAPTLVVLVLARALQGVGAGGLMTQSMAILGDVAAPKDRARYYAYFAIVYTAAGAMGPALGGFLSQDANWRAIFWLNLPIGVVGLLLTGRSLRHLPVHHRLRRLDWLGAVLIVAASVTTMYLFDVGGRGFAWVSPRALEWALGATALWIALGLRLAKAEEPLIPLAVLRNPIVRAATAANAFGWGAMVSLNVYLPIFLQRAKAFSATDAGLLLMVAMGIMNVSALVGAKVAGQVRRYKILPMAGLLLSGAASLRLAWSAADVSPVGFEILVALIGLGFGPTAPVTSVALQNAVKLNELGTSIALMTCMRNLFTSLLLAAFGALALRGPQGAQISASPTAQAQAAAVFALVFALAAASFCIAFLALARMEEQPLAASNAGRLVTD